VGSMSMRLVVKKTFWDVEMVEPDVRAKRRSRSLPSAESRAVEGDPALHKRPLPSFARSKPSQRTSVAGSMPAACVVARQVDAGPMATCKQSDSLPVFKELGMTNNNECIECKPVVPNLQQYEPPSTDPRLPNNSVPSMEDLLALKQKLRHALSLTNNKPPPLQESTIWFSGCSILRNFRAKQTGIGKFDSARPGSSSVLQCLAEHQGYHGREQKQQLRALQRQLALALAGIHPCRSRQVRFAMAPCVSGPAAECYVAGKVPKVSEFVDGQENERMRGPWTSFVDQPRGMPLTSSAMQPQRKTWNS